MTRRLVGGLETKRLVIRPWQLNEADRMYDLYRRDRVVRWLGAPPMSSPDEAVAIQKRVYGRLPVASVMRGVGAPGSDRRAGPGVT